MKNFNSITKSIFLVFCFLFSISVKAHKVTVKEVEVSAQSFVNSNFYGQSIDSIGILVNSDSLLIGYVSILNPSGYIVFSNNTDIFPIISYSKEGKFDFKESNTNILLHIVKWDLEARNEALSLKSYSLTKSLSENNTAWDNLLSGNNLYLKSAEETYGPLLSTTWKQDGYFNDYCPVDTKYGILNLRSVVGCVATAASQIINYWQFPKKINFDNNIDAYEYNCGNNLVNIPADYSSLKFPSFDILNNKLSNIVYNGDHEEIAYLCFGVGVKHEMNYSYNGSGTYQSGKVFRDLGFGSAFLNKWDNCKNKVISNIKNGWPVQVSIYNSELSSGHSVVFDGYKTTGEFHVNMGWGGTQDNWYFPPNIGNNYKLVYNVVYNICPYQGWSQWGGDSKNSKRTFYSIPTQNEVKWHVKSEGSRHHCEGLIVGESSDIIVSVSPMDLNQNEHPSIMIISEDGVKKSETFLNNENSSITYPVQNNKGEIYVATSNGNVYKINSSSGVGSLLFEEPNDKEFDTELKIDDEGYIYATTDSRLYCLNSSGNKIWQTSALSNSYFYRGAPATDVSRNKVYLSTYNSTYNSSSLLTIDRRNGQVLNEKNFSNIEYASQMVGVASIADNGMVYFGCKTKLYQLDPSNYNLSELYDNGFGYINEAPAIGKNGILYYYVWKNINEVAVIAFNPTTKNVNWEETYNTREIGEYGTINNIYVDYQNNICIVLHDDDGHNDEYVLLVYKDNGSSASFLWKKNIGSSGGFVALGPNNTLYYSNGDEITAISELSSGESFPQYTNNNPPNIPVYLIPSNGSVDLDTIVNFSWNCNEPDGNDLTYDFYIGLATDLLEIYKSKITSNSFSVEGLIQDTTYLWSIVASDGQSVTQGPIWSFSTKKYVDLPLKVTDPTPHNDTTNQSINVNLSWQNGGGATSFKVYFGTDPTPDSGESQGNQSGTSFNLGTLSYGTTYYWRIDAVNEAGTTTGDVWHFTTEAEPVSVPSKPISPSPENGAINQSRNVDLSWSNGGGATSFKVYFGTDPTPDSGESQGNQSGTSFNLGTLSYGTTYYWRIDAVNEAGTTTGDVWYFTTEAEPVSVPSKPISPSPENGATNQSRNVDLSWSNGGGATSFKVYFGTDPTPDSGELQGTQSGTSFNLGTLSYGTTYYWRIDAVNEAGTTTGDVWNFTTEAESNNQNELIWEDGFESYTSGTFPSNWVADANATNLSNNYTDNSTQKEGTNSLKLYGTVGGCWGALAYRSITISPPYYITFDVKNGIEQLSGCHPDRASIALRKGTSWSNPARSLVDFKNNGKIYANGSDFLESYTTDTWINVIVKYELPSSNQVKTTFWINNNLVGEFYSPSITEENELNNLQLAVQEGSAWFDNVKIYKFLYTSIDNKDYKSFIKIYPNPVKNMVTIAITDPKLINSNIRIIDSLGSIVSENRLDSYETKINVSNLVSGFYIIQIQNKNFIYNKKMTK